MRRKYVALTLGLVMTGMLLGGCGNSKDTGSTADIASSKDAAASSSPSTDQKSSDKKDENTVYGKITKADGNTITYEVLERQDNGASKPEGTPPVKPEGSADPQASGAPQGKDDKGKGGFSSTGETQTFTVTGDAVTITLNNVPDVELTGKIVGTDSSNVTKLVFTNNTSGTVNEATITGDSYKVSVKPGEYTTSVETKDGSTTYDRASVKAGAENVNDVYVEKDDPASKRDYSYTRVPSLTTTGSIAVENGKPHTVFEGVP